MTSYVRFQIPFTLSHGELVSALAWTERDTMVSELPASLSKAEVIRRVRDTLHWAGGEAYGYWSDGMSDDRAARLEAWAKAHVRTVWGEETAHGA